MMNFTELEEILLCPLTAESLRYSDDISNTKLSNLAPEEMKQVPGYVNESESCFYPILNNIICLLPQYAITSIHAEANKDIESVRSFYDQFGWVKNPDNKYNDNKLFVDQRHVADEYRSKTTKRVNNFLNSSGKYILDIASGPVYQEEYKEFSRNFEYRICIDLSIRALQEASQNLEPNHGIFILGDISNIPLKANSCDNVVSMHTLYHVPKEKQAIAIHEMVRVCQPDSKVIIAYNWGWNSILMNIALFPTRIIRLFGRVIKLLGRGKKQDESSLKKLYFYSHGRRFFRRNKPSDSVLEFNIQKSLHENFIKLYLGENRRSKKFLKSLFELESKYPSFFGKYGQFPLITLTKKGNSRQ